MARAPRGGGGGGAVPTVCYNGTFDWTMRRFNGRGWRADRQAHAGHTADRADVDVVCLTVNPA